MSRSIQSIFFITGDIAEGKTRFVERLVAYLEDEQVNLGGFYAPRLLDGVNTTGYDLIGLRTRERIEFLRENPHRDTADIGKFKVNQQAFTQVHNWLENDRSANAELVVIDEVGKWEMRGKGWSKELENLIGNPQHSLVLVVRRPFVDDVIKHWKFDRITIFDVDHITPEITAKLIYSKISKK